jgi:hypothetical protein
MEKSIFNNFANQPQIIIIPFKSKEFLVQPRIFGSYGLGLGLMENSK